MATKRVIRTLLILSILCLACGCSGAPPDSSRIVLGRDGIWYTGAVGAGTASHGVAGLTDYTALSVSAGEHRFFTLRTAGLTELQILGGTDPDPSNRDVGLLYGARTSGKHAGYLSVAAGLSYVHVVRRGAYRGSSEGWFSTGYYDRRVSNTFGISADAQAVFKPFPGSGLGLVVYGNLNPVSSFWGLGLSLLLGKLG